MTLSQRPVFWYERPGHLHIKLSPDEVTVSPMGHDTIIRKEVAGKFLKALVPTHTIGDCDGYKYVPVSVAGRKGDQLILHLPTSNEGRPTWLVGESTLQQILVNPH